MIRLNSIAVSHNGDRIFSDFSLSVSDGEKLVITGKSGAGKSTLLKAILGFTSVSNGIIEVNNMHMSPKNAYRIRKQIAYVSQGVDLFEDTVGSFFETLFTYRANHHLKYDHTKRDRLLDEFELPRSVIHKSTGDISGGERQRVALVAAVLLQRPIFLLDEPTAALDVHLKAKVASFFLDHPHWTVLSVTHDREWLESSLTRTLTLGE